MESEADLMRRLEREVREPRKLLVTGSITLAFFYGFLLGNVRGGWAKWVLAVWEITAMTRSVSRLVKERP